MFAKKNGRRQLYRMLVSTPSNQSLYRWRKRPFQMWPATTGHWLLAGRSEKPWPAAALLEVSTVMTVDCRLEFNCPTFKNVLSVLSRCASLTRLVRPLLIYVINGCEIKKRQVRVKLRQLHLKRDWCYPYPAIM